MDFLLASGSGTAWEAAYVIVALALLTRAILDRVRHLLASHAMPNTEIEASPVTSLTPTQPSSGCGHLLSAAMPCLRACLGPLWPPATARTMPPATEAIRVALSNPAADDAKPSPGLICEALGEHVMVLRWPRVSGVAGLDDARLIRDYEVARRVLAARRQPFGLVHDFRRVQSLTSLVPVARMVLPDAISIASSGLVRRVAVIHSFGGVLARSMMSSLASLSPVSPCRVFRGEANESVTAIAWIAAWASVPVGSCDGSGLLL